MLDQILHKAIELGSRNEPFVMATVVRRDRPSSGKTGDHAIILASGEMVGWLGGGCVKPIISKEAADALRTGKARLVKIGQSKSTQKEEGVMEYKMTCQSEGSVEVFLDPVLPKPGLVVIGKTAIAKSIVKLGKLAGYHVTAVAPEAKPDTFEQVDSLITQLKLDSVRIVPQTNVVVVTQGEDDEKALSLVLEQDCGYIGFVASRKKRDKVFEYLAAQGTSRGKLDTIHSPAGLDIGAKTPEQVAISILAEIISEQQKRGGEIYLRATEEKTNTPTNSYYINPVCGVPIDMNHPKHVLEYKGEKVYFCCDGCKIKFEQEPGKYIREDASA